MPAKSSAEGVILPREPRAWRPLALILSRLKFATARQELNTMESPTRTIEQTRSSSIIRKT
jgi:hypothetical protein